MALGDKALDQLLVQLHTLKIADDHPGMDWDDAYATGSALLRCV